MLLAAVDLSTAGPQLLSNLDEDYQREGSAWLKPCCGKRAAVWQAFSLSASVSSFLVACGILVVILLTLELLIDTKLQKRKEKRRNPCSWQGQALRDGEQNSFSRRRVPLRPWALFHGQSTQLAYVPLPNLSADASGCSAGPMGEGPRQGLSTRSRGG